MSDLDDKLQRAAETACEEPVQFQGFFPVVETFRGQVVWEGIVNMYAGASGSVYAWAVESDAGPQYVTVKQRPPVKNPLDAVRVWLVSESKK